MRAHLPSFVAGALFGSAAVTFYLLLEGSLRALRQRAHAVVIDDVRSPDEAELAVMPAPEARSDHAPLESESADIDPISQRW